MGICNLSPELRVLKAKNAALKAFILKQLRELPSYTFTTYLANKIEIIEDRFLFTINVLEDIDNLQFNSKVNMSSIIQQQFESDFVENRLHQEVKNSCLILQNEVDINQKQEDEPVDDLYFDNNQVDNNNKQAKLSFKNKNRKSYQQESPLKPNYSTSFKNNLQKNQSLVVQIDILYKSQVNPQDYSKSLQLFLKFTQIFKEHAYGGFLKVIYIWMVKFLLTQSDGDFDFVVDEMCVFVQFMVKVATECYGLQHLANLENGRLIKNQNVYNLIMAHLFKTSLKLKSLILSLIHSQNSLKIKLFKQKIHNFSGKNLSFFGVSKPFCLYEEKIEAQLNGFKYDKLPEVPYAESLKLMAQLCGQGSPITKLKGLISIAKQINQDIKRYYQDRQAPQLDPDNLTAIVCYLISMSKNHHLFEELKIVEYFTTSNCLNCISGYYLNVFMAGIETILLLEEDE